jgi:hypothetical protein
VGTAESAEISDFHPQFLCCSPPAKSSAESRQFPKLPRRCGRSSGAFAGDLKVPPEIQNVRWKFRFPADVLDFQLKI